MKNEIPFDKNVVEKTYDRLKPLFIEKVLLISINLTNYYSVLLEVKAN